MSRPIDTSRDADERQLNLFRAMTPGARLRLAGSMSTEITALTRSGIQARHPEYTPAEVEVTLVRILLGGVPAGSEARSPRPVRPR